MSTHRHLNSPEDDTAKREHEDHTSARVRRALVETLYTHPSSLAFGACAGVASTGIAALVTNITPLWVAFGLLAVVGVSRVIMAYTIVGDTASRSTTRLELLYELGAFTYALILGCAAAITLAYVAAAETRVLMVANALCYGVSVCARNAGRTNIAMGQLALVSIPIAIASASTGTLVSTAFAVTIALLVAGMTPIARNISEVLTSSITTAEENAAQADRMQTLARTDVVTGLSNRAGLNHNLVETMMAIKDDENLAVFWIDLDRFKEVNDLLGHPVGDRVLIEVARRLHDLCPEGSTVSRFGGDEFVMYCPIETRKDAERISSEIHAEIMRPIGVDGNRLEVRASVGVSLFPKDARNADSLMQHADQALYHAKVSGRSQTSFFDQSMTRDLVRRREIENELRTALQRDELSIFFQPIFDLESGKIRSFEALVRWFHPEKGELSPEEFIPVAEETGVILTLGNWITAQAAQVAARWPDDITLAVNLSPLQIRAPGAALGIQTAIKKAGLDPSRLELEVTESLLIDDNYATANFIEELSAIGVQFALDDFGTGYSSLGYINTFPFRKIKVDRSFVSGSQVGRRSEAIIRAVAEMGATLNMDIVAEGLETVEQVQSVREAGCNLGQGYYFSRPVPDYLAAMLIAQERDKEGGEPQALRA